MQKPDKKLIIAVDFDKTLANTDYPTIHNLNDHAKEIINHWATKHQAIIIIWTCRAGRFVDDVKNFLNKEGVIYHYINEQEPYLLHLFNNDTRKISADIYIDDKDIHAQLNPNFPNWIDIALQVEEILNLPNFKSILDHK